MKIEVPAARLIERARASFGGDVSPAQLVRRARASLGIDAPPSQLLDRARASLRKGQVVARNLRTYTERQIAARRLARQLSAAEHDDAQGLRELGFRALSPLAGTDELISVCRRLIAERAESTPRFYKKYFAQLLEPADLTNHPCLLGAALDPHVLQVLTASYGIVPFLESVELFVSFPDYGDLQQSQLWHVDRTDSVVVKQIVYIDDVGPEEGPFSLLPKPESRKVSPLRKHYLTDSEIGAEVDLARVISFQGASGSRALVDTGQCFHFGSRVSRRRHALFCYYNTGYGKFARRGDWRSPGVAERPLSPLQRKVLDL